jgi:uncharacterized protein
MIAGRPPRGRWSRVAVPIALGCGLLAAIPAAGRMARLYENLRAELDELLPPGAPAVRGARTLRARAAGSQYLGVVVRGPQPGPPAEMATALGARMQAFATSRPDLIAAVRTDIAAERAFLARRGALYLPLADLHTIADRLEARVSWEKARANPLFVSLDDDDRPPSVDFGEIAARARASDPFAGRFADGRLVSADGRTAIVLIFLATAEAGAGELMPIVERARTEVAALRGAPGALALEVGYAGDVAIAVEELSALESDVALSALLVMVGVILSILLAFRVPRALPALALPLAVGTVWGFGAASLFVSSLGSSTAFLGSIVIGNGINPGIILLARYLEERRRGAPPPDAAVVAMNTTWRGTLAAAVAAAAGYASLAATSFRGFNEFGVIASAGALTCWLATYLYLPRLLRHIDARRAVDAPERSTAARAAVAPGGRIAALITEHAGRTLAVSLALIAVAAVLATRLDGTRIEYDMSKLRNRESLRTGEGYWGAHMDALLGRNFTAVAFMTETPAQAAEVGAALAGAVKKDPLSSVSSRLVRPDDLIPPDTAAKRAELGRIARLLTPGVQAALADDDRAAIDKLLGAAAPGPITPDELPLLLARGMREKDGRFGRTLLMLQSLDTATWDGAVTIRAARAVEEVARTVSPPAAVAGGFVVSANILETLEREAAPTTAAAFGAVALVVLILFRGRRATLWVVAALLGGTTLLAGAVIALDIRINFLSFIAFPITFGIGVEYALNVVYRHRQDQEASPRVAREQLGAVVSGTGRAVALCSLTTIIGYGSLLLARNQALFSFGVLAVLGEICCLAVAVVALPAALAVSEVKAARTRRACDTGRGG